MFCVFIMNNFFQQKFSIFKQKKNHLFSDDIAIFFSEKYFKESRGGLRNFFKIKEHPLFIGTALLVKPALSMPVACSRKFCRILGKIRAALNPLGLFVDVSLSKTRQSLSLI